MTKGKEQLFEERPEELWVIARREDRLRALAEWNDIPLRRRFCITIAGHCAGVGVAYRTSGTEDVVV